MKSVFTLSALALAFGLVQTADAQPKQPQQQTQQVQTQTLPLLTTTNYWDAKVWDREGGAAFWHAKSDKRTPKANRVNGKPATKGGRHLKKLFNR
ncbi:MAG: hypothetical protein HKN23_04610 [Verrucomicrobiales bacterium]|nr:hypothetical protein [Verrucomicrobiales bacterium]